MKIESMTEANGLVVIRAIYLHKPDHERVAAVRAVNNNPKNIAGALRILADCLEADDECLRQTGGN